MGNQGMWLMQIAMLGILGYLVVNMMKMSKRNAKNQRMLKVLDAFSNEEEFYKLADENIAKETDVEFQNKTRVLRLWADVRYEHDEQFYKDLEELNLDVLLKEGKNQKVSSVELNEDSFFYLYLAIPNRLYYRNRMDLCKPLFEKLSNYESKYEHALFLKLSKENQKYYTKQEDRGKAFDESLLAGEYGGYQYSKQLIGIYKNIANAMLARIYLDDQDPQGFGWTLDMLESFVKSPLGERYLMELDITLPSVENNSMDEINGELEEEKIQEENVEDENKEKE